MSTLQNPPCVPLPACNSDDRRQNNATENLKVNKLCHFVYFVKIGKNRFSRFLRASCYPQFCSFF